MKTSPAAISRAAAILRTLLITTVPILALAFALALATTALHSQETTLFGTRDGTRPRPTQPTAPAQPAENPTDPDAFLIEDEPLPAAAPQITPLRAEFNKLQAERIAAYKTAMDTPGKQDITKLNTLRRNYINQGGRDVDFIQTLDAYIAAAGRYEPLPIEQPSRQDSLYAWKSTLNDICKSRDRTIENTLARLKTNYKQRYDTLQKKALLASDFALANEIKAEMENATATSATAIPKTPAPATSDTFIGKWINGGDSFEIRKEKGHLIFSWDGGISCKYLGNSTILVGEKKWRLKLKSLNELVELNITPGKIWTRDVAPAVPKTPTSVIPLATGYPGAFIGKWINGNEYIEIKKEKGVVTMYSSRWNETRVCKYLGKGEVSFGVWGVKLKSPNQLVEGEIQNPSKIWTRDGAPAVPRKPVSGFPPAPSAPKTPVSTIRPALPATDAFVGKWMNGDEFFEIKKENGRLILGWDGGISCKYLGNSTILAVEKDWRLKLKSPNELVELNITPGKIWFREGTPGAPPPPSGFPPAPATDEKILFPAEKVSDYLRKYQDFYLTENGTLEKVIKPKYKTRISKMISMNTYSPSLTEKSG